MKLLQAKIKKACSSLVILWVGFAVLGAHSCCYDPTANLFGPSPNFPWLYRNASVYEQNSSIALQVDAATSISEPVSAFGPIVTEFSFKVGPFNSVDCLSPSGYSAWTPKTHNLEADLTSFPDGQLKLCLVGRGVNSCGDLRTQPYSRASSYTWILNRPPSAFSISGPAHNSSSSNPTVSWQASSGADSYDLLVSLNSNCSAPIQSFSNLTTTSQTLDSLPDATYYACVTAKDIYGSTLPATNNSYDITIDTLAPGNWELTAPSGQIDNLNTLASWTQSTGAEHYHIGVATDSACSQMVADWDNLVTTSANISIPSSGSFYLCGAAMDMAGNMAMPSNNGLNFNISAQEVVVKDHKTDPSCWNTDKVAYHFNAAGESDALAAASFIGQGGILKRVGGIFADSNCSNFNNGHIENMETSVAFYENVSVFLSDPYLKNQPANSLSKRVSVAKLHTNPADPQYFLNPVRTTAQGTQEYYVEADVSSLNIHTTLGQQHLVALWFSTDVAEDGSTWMVLSQGCAGQVGSQLDYYKSNNTATPIGPNTFQALSAAHNFATYFITEQH